MRAAMKGVIAGRTLKTVRAVRENWIMWKVYNPAWGAYVVPRAGFFVF